MRVLTEQYSARPQLTSLSEASFFFCSRDLRSSSNFFRFFSNSALRSAIAARETLALSLSLSLSHTHPTDSVYAEFTYLGMMRPFPAARALPRTWSSTAVGNMAAEQKEGEGGEYQGPGGFGWP